METIVAHVTKQLGARIDARLFRDLRVLAAKEGRTMQDLTEEALRDLLAKYKGGKRGGNASQA
jgi:hypothetical protein